MVVPEAAAATHATVGVFHVFMIWKLLLSCMIPTRKLATCGALQSTPAGRIRACAEKPQAYGSATAPVAPPGTTTR
jgi:hypothetical protein